MGWIVLVGTNFGCPLPIDSIKRYQKNYNKLKATNIVVKENKTNDFLTNAMKPVVSGSDGNVEFVFRVLLVTPKLLEAFLLKSQNMGIGDCCII